MARSRMYRYMVFSVPLSGSGKFYLRSTPVCSQKEVKELFSTETLLVTDFYTGQVVAHRSDMGSAGLMTWVRHASS